MTWAAVAVGGASLLSGLIGGSASEKAAQQQAQAEEQALQQQMSIFNRIQGNEQPFIAGGQNAQSQLNFLLGEGTPGVGGTASGSSGGAFGSLNQPFTADTFKSLSPAYQFQLQQGGQGTLNQGASAQGAESGSALSGLQSYNQQFANTSFNNAFNQYQTQQNNIFGRLSNLATLGANAGSNSATGGTGFASGIGGTQAAIGAAQAGGTVGAANAITGGLQGAAPFLGNTSGSTVGYNPNSINDESNYSTALNPQSPAGNYWPTTSNP